MSVPHILADESSAYYHAYVLAEMSVHQTRAHFKRKYGTLVDNDKVSAHCTAAASQHITCSVGKPFEYLVCLDCLPQLWEVTAHYTADLSSEI